MRARRLIRAGVTPIGVLALASSVFQTSQAQEVKLHADLIGFQEVPALLSTGEGEFIATVDPSRASITFTVTYSGLLADATQSHIHFGQRGVNGGIMIFFCTNLTPPAGVPVPQHCPLREGTVTGTVTAADVVGPAAQGVAPMSLDNVISAIQSGQIYANVHSTRWPGGEIRGQVKVSGPKK
jgi:CHRD domain-containing protein